MLCAATGRPFKGSAFRCTRLAKLQSRRTTRFCWRPQPAEPNQTLRNRFSPAVNDFRHARRINAVKGAGNVRIALPNSLHGAIKKLADEVEGRVNKVVRILHRELSREP